MREFGLQVCRSLAPRQLLKTMLDGLRPNYGLRFPRSILREQALLILNCVRQEINYVARSNDAIRIGAMLINPTDGAALPFPLVNLRREEGLQ
jgi:hypothetical protein